MKLIQSKKEENPRIVFIIKRLVDFLRPMSYFASGALALGSLVAYLVGERLEERYLAILYVSIAANVVLFETLRWLFRWRTPPVAREPQNYRIPYRYR